MATLRIKGVFCLHSYNFSATEWRLEAQSLRNAMLSEPSHQQANGQVHYLSRAVSSWSRSQTHPDYMSSSPVSICDRSQVTPAPISSHRSPNIVNPAAEKQSAKKNSQNPFSLIWFLSKRPLVFSDTLLYLYNWAANRAIHSIFQASDWGGKVFHIPVRRYGHKAFQWYWLVPQMILTFRGQREDQAPNKETEGTARERERKTREPCPVSQGCKAS